jgi:4-alpha-glucanotransferase
VISLAPTSPCAPRERIRAALDVLGVRNLLFGIHDAAFPSRTDEDAGRGTPYSEGAARLLDLVADLGFSGVQLGPQGITSAADPSPYDGTLFSKNPLSVALASLAAAEGSELLAREELHAVVAARPGPRDRVPYDYVFQAQRRALSEAYARFRRRSAAGDPGLEPLARGFAAFRRANAEWLERDAFYEILERQYGGRHFTQWVSAEGEPLPDQFLWAPPRGEEEVAVARRARQRETHAVETEGFAFTQYLLHEQHRRLRGRLARLGLKLFGDLQVGLSARDVWFARGFLLRDYVMGAPPSRTNPEGQAWSYGVLDPARYFAPWAEVGRREGPALRFLRARVGKMFDEFDGIRVDHPHGLVCPWVYRSGTRTPIRAVQQGARLFASPDLPDHPDLARHAIARPDQLDRSRPRHDDGWVRELTEEQVDRYGVAFAIVLEEATRRGRSSHDVACEILSTQPYPLGRVIARHGLGRFRVTQKADLDRPDDVYRGENAGPEDWIMLGNHDTRPIWRVAEDWLAQGASRQQAEYLASRLLSPGEDRDAWVARTAADLPSLVRARFADLFVGPARNVHVFFTDLLGLREAYNRPGTVDPQNWSLRVAPSFREDYESRRRAGLALDLPRALARALRARGKSFSAAHAGLIGDLEGSGA